MFRWRYLDGDGAESGVSEAFEDRTAAEEWMGSAWSELLDRGVEQVVLADEDGKRTLYRMGLREE